MQYRTWIVGGFIPLTILCHGSNTLSSPTIQAVGPQASFYNTPSSQIALPPGAIWATARGYLGHLEMYLNLFQIIRSAKLIIRV